MLIIIALNGLSYALTALYHTPLELSSIYRTHGSSRGTIICVILAPHLITTHIPPAST
jgi:hypothetical protein